MKSAPLAVVIELSDYRAARRAGEVLRGLLRDLPGVCGVSVGLKPDGTVALVVMERGLKAEIVRACIPTSVNSVPVRVVSEGAEAEKLKKDINYWREEALLAEEQGDEEQARKYCERAETLQRRLEALIRRGSSPR